MGHGESHDHGVNVYRLFIPKGNIRSEQLGCAEGYHYSQHVQWMRKPERNHD